TQAQEALPKKGASTFTIVRSRREVRGDQKEESHEKCLVSSGQKAENNGCEHIPVRVLIIPRPSGTIRYREMMHNDKHCKRDAEIINKEEARPRRCLQLHPTSPHYLIGHG